MDGPGALPYSRKSGGGSGKGIRSAREHPGCGVAGPDQVSSRRRLLVAPGRCGLAQSTNGAWGGAHACEAEFDPETGHVRIVAWTGVDDVGRAINPLILHGQAQGAIVQGVGQALLEAIRYTPVEPARDRRVHGLRRAASRYGAADPHGDQRGAGKLTSPRRPVRRGRRPHARGRRDRQRGLPCREGFGRPPYRDFGHPSAWFLSALDDRISLVAAPRHGPSLSAMSVRVCSMPSWRWRRDSGSSLTLGPQSVG